MATGASSQSASDCYKTFGTHSSTSFFKKCSLSSYYKMLEFSLRNSFLIEICAKKVSLLSSVTFKRTFCPKFTKIFWANQKQQIGKFENAVVIIVATAKMIKTCRTLNELVYLNYSRIPIVKMTSKMLHKTRNL